MARIRTVKPDFFRDEDLQDLERAHAGKCVMLVFAGLWGHCDKNGNFEWRPRTLKLDILPFLDFDMEQTLELLVAEGFVVKYSVDGQDYGHIETFGEHQRISGKESQEPARFPKFSQSKTGELFPTSQGNTGEASGMAGREGKGREGNGKPKSDIPFDQIIDAYNRTMVKIAKVRDLTHDRRKLITKAWDAGEDRQDVDFWLAYFEECAADDFLNGTGPYKNGHEKWRPTFDYLMRPEVITKTYEAAMHRLEQRGVH